MAWQILRTIVEDGVVSEAVDQLSADHTRFPEAWDALKWLLARNPVPHGSVRRMVGTEEYRLYVLSGDPVAGTPDVWVVYSYTDDQVDIHGINAGATSTDEIV